MLLFALLISGAASVLEVTGGFTGWWGQPEQQNHGVIVAVSRLPSGEKTGVLYWAHFDEEGNPSWLFAQGDIDDDRIEARVFEFDGITFMQTQEDGVTSPTVSIASFRAPDGFACKAKWRRHSNSTSRHFNAAGGFVRSPRRACLSAHVDCVVGA